MEIKKYCSEMKEEWDSFICDAKNGMFLFYRDYMEYHEDRFEDNSLLIYEDCNLISVLPASINDNVLYSHGGLTFGGFITNQKMKQHKMNTILDAVIKYLRNNNIKKLVYKEIPHIYHKLPSEEDHYALFWENAKLVKVECATVLDIKNRIKPAKGRKSQRSRARREGVQLRESEDFNTFINMENRVLNKYHGASATHTGAELTMLHGLFPENIKLYAAYYRGKMIAGAVIYDNGNVVRTQYLGADDEARRNGALDYIIFDIMERYSDRRWLDFGKSTEGNGNVLNEGLIAEKEGFGGRTVIYRTWELEP